MMPDRQKQYANRHNERRAAIREKFRHPVDELWYRCDGIRAVISTYYRLRPALFRYDSGKLLAVGEPLKPVVHKHDGTASPFYHVWTGERYVDMPADSILSRSSSRGR